MTVKLFSIEPAIDGTHKYTATILVFVNNKMGWKLKKIHFGASGMMDYTLFYRRDGKAVADEHRQNYITRHEKTEDWRNPLTAGFWSRWVLWEETTVSQAVEALLKKHPSWRI